LHATPAPSPEALDALRDRFRATLLGCAIGDALGFPHEGAAPEVMARVPELAEDFRPRPKGKYAKGQYTDDTQMTLALAASIAEEGKIDGRAVASRFAQLWRDDIILAAGETTDAAMKRILKGKPWMSAGGEVGRAGNGAAMRASPIGLWHCDDPSRVCRDSEIQGVITHKDPRALAGAAVLACAVALALGDELPGHKRFTVAVAEVAQAQSPDFAEHLSQLPRLLKWETRSAVAAIRKLGQEPGVVPEEPGITGFVIPSVTMALYAFLRQPDDYRESIRLVLQSGGDVDTIGAMTGALLGARLGLAGLPARLRKGILHADVIMQIADQLFDRRFPAPKPVPAPVARHARVSPSRIRR
jgi:ADP-ribosylglycohydrolase